MVQVSEFIKKSKQNITVQKFSDFKTLDLNDEYGVNYLTLFFNKEEDIDYLIEKLKLLKEL